MRERIEAATDAAMSSVIDAIGDDLPAVVDTTREWSSQIVEFGWFPPDPLKRASG